MRAAWALTSASVLFAAAAAWANVTMNPLFTSDMVLQHGKPVPVWGTAAPGEQVTVKINGQQKTAVAGATGAWKIALDTLAIGGPYQMQIQGANAITLNNVMGGDVWLCSGQSNMTIGLGAFYKADTLANGYPNLRLFSQKSDIAGVGPWKQCSPATASGFSATGFFYGKYLSDSLKIPIGLIVGAVGATCIELWMSTQSVLDDPAIDTAQVFSGCSDGGFAGGNKGAGLYRNVIAPLIPFALRGTVWYQGEWNTMGNMSPDKYQGRFTELIKGWRKEFGQGDLPFYFVQLPNYNSNDAWYAIREAQRLTGRNTANTGMAIAIDLGGGVPGYPDSTELHPRDKKDVGYRLALISLANAYGRPIAAPSGPLFKSLSVRNDTAHLVFDYVGSGLAIKNGGLAGFEIAAANDENFVPATAAISGNEVLVYKTGSKVTRVRYAWKSNPVATLYNQAGLPAAPFRTYIGDVVGLADRGAPPRGVRATGSNRPSRIFDVTGQDLREPEGVYFLAPR
jgi:sialate O-acetylesterase